MPSVGRLIAWTYCTQAVESDSLGGGDVGRLAAVRLSNCGLDLGGELRARRQSHRTARA